MHSLPVFLRLAGRPVILAGDGDAAAAKRRLLERAGAHIVGEADTAALAIVALDDDAEAEATVGRLKARGIWVNAVDRPALCDFTLPAIVDRSPVLIAIGTGGASAGLAKALRQRLEAILPPTLGALANALAAARNAIRARFPDTIERRLAIDAALEPGGVLDPLTADRSVANWLESAARPEARSIRITLRSSDPDDLTLAEARWLGRADRIYHPPATPAAILRVARADATLIAGEPPAGDQNGVTVVLEAPPRH